MAAVTQATSCCSVVTVMRTGSVYIGRLKDRGTHAREGEREREMAEQMHRRGKDGFMWGVKGRVRRREYETGREVQRQESTEAG